MFSTEFFRKNKSRCCKWLNLNCLHYLKHWKGSFQEISSQHLTFLRYPKCKSSSIPQNSSLKETKKISKKHTSAIPGTQLNLRFVLTEGQRDCKIFCSICLARRAELRKENSLHRPPTVHLPVGYHMQRNKHRD